MTFSSFTRTESGNIIYFKNATPIKAVKDLKYYKDDSSGTFDKKEFRWSFDNNYWSSWDTLNQGNVSNISVGGNYNLFFEVRYNKSNADAKVTIFSIDYIELSTSDQKTCPVIPGEIISPTPIPPDYGGTTPCDTGVSEVVNATTLCGEPCDYYLWRPNHKGQQPISTVTDLQKILNNLSGGIQNSIVDASTVVGSGYGVYSEKIGQTLYFKRIDASGSISISEAGGVITLSSDASGGGGSTTLEELTDVSIGGKLVNQVLTWDGNYWVPQDVSGTSGGGVSQAYVDASLAARDASITFLFDWNYVQDASINNIVGELTKLDASIIRIDASINDIYDILKTLDNSTGILDIENIGGGDASIWKETDFGTAKFRSIDGSGIVDVYTDGDKIIISADTSIAVDPCTWSDPDPISADVGGLSSGDTFVGDNPIEILEEMLYEYFPPTASMQIDPSPGPTSSTRYYEKWVDTPISQGVSLTYSFDNDDFTKVLVYDVSLYQNGLYYRTDSWGGDGSISPYTTFDGAPDIGSASNNLIYAFEFGNKAGGVTMPNYDTSIALQWIDPYFYGTVTDTTDVGNIDDASIRALNKRIVPEQTNDITFDVSANFAKIKFVYAYPASYGDLRSIFDVKNDFNVTTSFDTTTVNVKMSGPAGPGPYVAYTVYIKNHWISFSPDVSTFKLDFNI